MVGLAEVAVTRNPNFTLCTSPLGACVGVAIYDPVAKVGGILHSLLPASSIDPKRAALRPAMFLDTGFQSLISHAEDQGATKPNLRVCVAGGAQIMDAPSGFNVGKRNYDALLEILAQHGLKIHAEDIGGRANRSMQLHVATGELRLKATGETVSKILCKP